MKIKIDQKPKRENNQIHRGYTDFKRTMVNMFKELKDKIAKFWQRARNYKKEPSENFSTDIP